MYLLHKLSRILPVFTSITLLFMFTFAAAQPANAGAAPLQSKQTACDSLETLDSSQKCGTGDSTINSIVLAIVKILSYVIGFVSIIMIMVGGLKYMTSNGDSNGTANAKNTIIYALIGLAVAALAQLMVHYVLNAVKI